MAAALELIIRRESSVDDLISWLTGGKNEKSGSVDLLTGSGVFRYEFLPYLLNYLRDQSSYLLNKNQLISGTPVATVTPSSVHKVKKSSLRAPSSSSSRTQLFSFTSDKAPGSASSNSLSSSHNLNISNKSRDSRQRRITPTKESKSAEKLSLSDFFTPELQQTKKKRAPCGGRSAEHQGAQDKSSEEVFPPPNKGRSGVKGRNSSGHKEKKKPLVKQQSPPRINLDDPRDFPPVDSQPKPSRRIKPTPVVRERSAKKEHWQPCFNVAATSAGDLKAAKEPGHSLALRMASPSLQNTNCNNGLQEERELLKLERLKQRTFASNLGSAPTPDCQPALPPFPTHHNSQPMLSPTTPTKPAAISRLLSEADEADKQLVTHKSVLDTLAEVYARCIQVGLVPNMMIELYFLIQLLLVKNGPGDEIPVVSLDPDETKYLSSVHNVVYFAIAVLSQIISILSLLDKNTLRMLVENSRIASFSETLRSELSVIYDELLPERSFLGSLRPPLTGVAFCADTDNRHNFPTDKSFHTFKKQRDVFYELIREWEDKSNESDWNMKLSMESRIKMLVHPDLGMANHIHFARLFQQQLISMCKGDNKLPSNLEETELLSQLRKTNPEKYKRLRERLTAPSSVQGPCPQPSFTGCQKFFKTFITVAHSNVFNQHLSDSLAAKIVELNSLQLTLPESGDSTIDQEQRESYSDCLLTLRLMAKFLGFIVFLPYQTVDRLPDSLLTSTIEIRNRSIPFLDVMTYVKVAEVKGHLVLTLPWVIEYLSLADAVTPSLGYYQALLEHLYTIYRSLVLMLRSERRFNYSYFLLVLLLGWLFENPVFASGWFYTWSLEKSIETKMPASSDTLDNSDLVDQSLLAACCPFLGELRMLLAEWAAGIDSKGGNLKKITPVAADKEEIDTSTKEKDNHLLQAGLEDNFFHNHSSSLKKVVEFVGERTTSNCVKQLKNTVLAEVTREAIADLRQLVEEMAGQEGATLSRGTKERLARDTDSIISRASSRARLRACEQAKRYCKEKCTASIKLLLPDDTSVQVLETAAHITIRRAYDKANIWISAKFPNAIQRDASTALEKLLKQQQFGPSKSAGAQKFVRTPEAKLDPDPRCHPAAHLLSPATLLEGLKETVKLLMSPHKESSTLLPSIQTQLADVRCLITTKQEVTPLAFTRLCQLTVELAAATVVRNPEYMRQPDPTWFIELWLEEDMKSADVPFHIILSGRTAVFLAKHSPNQKASWMALLNLCMELMKNKLLSFHEIMTSLVNLNSLGLLSLDAAYSFCHWLQNCQPHLEEFMKDAVNSECLTSLQKFLFTFSENFKRNQEIEAAVRQCLNLYFSSGKEPK